MEGHGRKRYFSIDENSSSKEIYALLDDIDSGDELDVDNLVNDSDTELMVERQTQPEEEIQDTSIFTPEASTHVISTDPPNEDPKKKDKKGRSLEMQ